MGKQFAVHDWVGHALGEPSTWPPQWRTAVATALTSKFPIVVWLGPQLRLVYNDAYLPMLGDRHPAALGETEETVWWDIWPTVGPMLAGVMCTGEATWSDDLMLALVTDGRPWEQYFTFGYSAIMGEDGEPCGVFCAVTETTERVLSERRMRLLSVTDAMMLGTRTVQQVVDAAWAVGDGDHPDVPFLAVYTGTDTGMGTASASATATATGADGRGARLVGAGGGAPGPLPPTADPLLPAGGLPAGSLHELDLARSLPSSAGRPTARSERSERSAVHAPNALLTRLSEHGEDYLLLGLNPHRRLDARYQEFCGLLSDLRAHRLDPVIAHDILLCTSEALAGAVEHGAMANRKRHIGLEMFADPDLIRTTVSDPGHWTGDTELEEETVTTGLTLIRSMAEHTHIDRGPRGTVFTMHHGRASAAEPRSA